MFFGILLGSNLSTPLVQSPRFPQNFVCMGVVLLCAAATAWSPPTAIAPSFATASFARTMPARCSEYDRSDPPYQRDAIVLLWGSGWQTLVRSASTGPKEVPGWDLPGAPSVLILVLLLHRYLNLLFGHLYVRAALGASVGCAAILALTWLAAASATGVLDERRYDWRRLLLTWL